MTNHEWITHKFSEPGYFIEAGAHDGVGDSQTKALEDAGWTGICVEPSSAFRGLRRSRKCKIDNRCLWKEDNVTVAFQQVRGDGIELSGIKQCFCDHWDRTRGKLRQKQAVTLTTLLREHEAPSVIEWLALDTEGSEHDILSVHDFAAYRFLAITVEHNNVQKQRDLVRALLVSNGYVVARENSIEDSYLYRNPAIL
jgi:hypothetical protein